MVMYGEELDIYEEPLEFGTFPPDIIRTLLDKDDVHGRSKAIEIFRDIMYGTTDMTPLQTNMKRFTSFMSKVLKHRDVKTVTFALTTLEILVVKLSKYGEPYCNAFVNLLLLRMGEHDLMIKEGIMKVFSRMMRTVTPMRVIRDLCQDLLFRKHRIKRDAIEVIAASLILYPRANFDFYYLGAMLAETLLDRSKYVRLMCLETCALVGQTNLGRYPLMAAIESMEITPRGGGMIDAVQFRIARLKLPKINEHGLITPTITVPASSFNFNEATADPDLIFIMKECKDVQPSASTTSLLPVKHKKHDKLKKQRNVKKRTLSPYDAFELVKPHTPQTLVFGTPDEGILDFFTSSSPLVEQGSTDSERPYNLDTTFDYLNCSATNKLRGAGTSFPPLVNGDVRNPEESSGYMILCATEELLNPGAKNTYRKFGGAGLEYIDSASSNDYLSSGVTEEYLNSAATNDNPSSDPNDMISSSTDKDIPLGSPTHIEKPASELASPDFLRYSPTLYKKPSPFECLNGLPALPESTKDAIGLQIHAPSPALFKLSSPLLQKPRRDGSPDLLNSCSLVLETSIPNTDEVLKMDADDILKNERLLDAKSPHALEDGNVNDIGAPITNNPDVPLSPLEADLSKVDDTVNKNPTTLLNEDNKADDLTPNITFVEIKDLAEVNSERTPLRDEQNLISDDGEQFIPVPCGHEDPGVQKPGLEPETAVGKHDSVKDEKSTVIRTQGERPSRKTSTSATDAKTAGSKIREKRKYSPKGKATKPSISSLNPKAKAKAKEPEPARNKENTKSQQNARRTSLASAQTKANIIEIASTKTDDLRKSPPDGQNVQHSNTNRSNSKDMGPAKRASVVGKYAPKTSIPAQAKPQSKESGANVTKTTSVAGQAKVRAKVLGSNVNKTNSMPAQANVKESPSVNTKDKDKSPRKYSLKPSPVPAKVEPTKTDPNVSEKARDIRPRSMKSISIKDTGVIKTEVETDSKLRGVNRSKYDMSNTIKSSEVDIHIEKKPPLPKPPGGSKVSQSAIRGSILNKNPKAQDMKTNKPPVTKTAKPNVQGVKTSDSVKSKSAESTSKSSKGTKSKNSAKTPTSPVNKTPKRVELNVNTNSSPSMSDSRYKEDGSRRRPKIKSGSHGILDTTDAISMSPPPEDMSPSFQSPLRQAPLGLSPIGNLSPPPEDLSPSFKTPPPPRQLSPIGYLSPPPEDLSPAFKSPTPPRRLSPLGSLSPPSEDLNPAFKSPTPPRRLSPLGNLSPPPEELSPAFRTPPRPRKLSPMDNLSPPPEDMAFKTPTPPRPHSSLIIVTPYPHLEDTGQLLHILPSPKKRSPRRNMPSPVNMTGLGNKTSPPKLKDYRILKCGNNELPPIVQKPPANVHRFSIMTPESSLSNKNMRPESRLSNRTLGSTGQSSDEDDAIDDDQYADDSFETDTGSTGSTSSDVDLCCENTTAKGLSFDRSRELSRVSSRLSSTPSKHSYKKSTTAKAPFGKK